MSPAAAGIGWPLSVVKAVTGRTRPRAAIVTLPARIVPEITAWPLYVAGQTTGGPIEVGVTPPGLDMPPGKHLPLRLSYQLYPLVPMLPPGLEPPPFWKLRLPTASRELTVNSAG